MPRLEQNQRDSKTKELKRDAASNAGRGARNQKEYKPEEERKGATRQVIALNRNTLNDLYERSSI
ncbi:MAG: hypothetical protein ACXWV0_01725 [Flavisolibacter sp.]